jgi:16S rRNA (guanine527-N7)-methyltransferase
VTQPLDARLVLHAAHHGITLASSHAAAIARYLQLLARWNERMNLTALPLAGFPDHTLDRLVIEPLAAARFVRGDAVDWLDVGSGGGSPAVPLKVVAPVLDLTMVESSQRKGAFLREAVRTLSLNETRVLVQRIETVTSDAAADLITVRAVGIAEVRDSLERLLRPGGQLFHFQALEQQPIDFKDLILEKRVELPPPRSLLTIWRRPSRR